MGGKKIFDFAKLVINENSSINELFKVLSISINPNYGSGFAIVVDSNGEIVGTVQDSDIRKYLASKSVDGLKIQQVMRRDFISVENDLSHDQVIDSIIDQMNNRGNWNTALPVRVIPITKGKIPVGILDLEELKERFSNRKSQHIVIGLGYVGLTLALALTQVGKKVFGYETNQEKVDLLRSGNSYIHEPGIGSLLKSKLNDSFFVEDSLSFLSQDFGIQRIFYICVGTPLKSNKSVNLEYIDAVISTIIKCIKPLDIIIMRSTVPVGTGQKIIASVSGKLDWKVGADFHYISAPERTIEGDALREIREIPQLIAGATIACRSAGSRIFEEISNSVVHLERIEAAELTKLMGNAFRDYIFGFSNHLIEVAKKIDLDINTLIKASNLGYSRSFIPLPSPGVGGPCLTKDSYLIYDSELDRKQSPILAARKTNELVIENSIKFIKLKCKDIKSYDCLVIGAAFKGVPETNDIRNSPSLEFISLLDNEVRSISVWDSTIPLQEVKALGKRWSTNFSMIAILNNNPKNLEYFFEQYPKLIEKEIIIFDPWQLIEPQRLILEKPSNLIHYFTLSKYLELRK